MKSSFLERGGAWVLAQSLLMPLVVALGPWCRGSVASNSLRAGAGALLAAGAAFGIAGVWMLGRNRTIFPKPNEDSELIQRGVYRLVRHPLYTSLTLLALGWALWWASWPTLFAALAQTILLDQKSRREEVWLRARFPTYADYARRVRRLVPWVY
jgi:protein-S-isoprenylcysteine O-methyltransferase Ste14